MQKTIRYIIGLVIFPLLLMQQSCGYKLSGASIPPEMKTISVQFFENNSSLVVPYLSQQFTEALKERIRSQSRLNIIRSDADANFEGRISDYSIRPVAIQGNERAGLNRLTITVFVKYTNTLKPEQGFEQSFSRFKDFSVQTRTLQAQEADLIKEINVQLTEDIFNRAFANW
ncbi:LPS assembly lipoprotein LptE [Daejeonella oryzae]|uniref:LPS assembly lipoprotein LptE n=1 Tax=Daejeonella oryzae TaxID=1122943 RepID=UPI00047AFC2C|nr:LptE family protein [Daejeonella oryzae]